MRTTWLNAALAGLTTATLAAVLPLGSASATTSATTAPPTTAPTTANRTPAPGNCLWLHTFTADETDDNYAFPDSGAMYWAASFSIPAGAKLDLVGRFAHARYQSLNSYDVSTNAPVDALNDVSTRPDKGSRNPFKPGARRDGEKHRSYTVRVSAAQVPTTPRRRNTLYAGVAGQDTQVLLYRVYLPDRGRGIAGGAGLPQPRLTLADGTVLRGTKACTALEASRTKPAVAVLPMPMYRALRDQPGKPATFPALKDPRWIAYYNTNFGIQCTYFDQCSGNPERINQQYANIDNKYVSTQASRSHGPVLTLRGTLPVTPSTLHREKRMTAKVDMRYWSLCTNESMATTRVQDCVNDEDVVTNRKGRYTIVISSAADRPSNAVRRCGVTWVEAPRRGDGAGHPDDDLILIRNMLPSKRFTHAVQNTSKPGDEKAVMGEYLPTSTYSSVETFEKRGC